MGVQVQPENGGHWTATLVELIRRTATDLPDDVVAALQKARLAESETPRARGCLEVVVENAFLARKAGTPLCQDTGTLTFYWRAPRGADQRRLEDWARAAVAEATRRGYLRRNTIETLSGASLDDNLAHGCPVMHFEQCDNGRTEVWLLLKGGGSENVSTQYSLPDDHLKAGRDLAGVRACVLHAVWRAQGMGCAPGILGVCIGGDRAEGYREAKRQLLRPLGDAAPQPELARLERELLAAANTLGIGPMGLGGKTTLLGVKATVRSRLPASYFVSVAYMCWACRRRGVVLDAAGAPVEWLEP
ncbi:MAG: fumarate hydratase [Kiritimatiellae bacterium]|nr:fumarate hydratase [Kiritimatiellia bacterium]